MSIPVGFHVDALLTKQCFNLESEGVYLKICFAFTVFTQILNGP